MSEINQEVPTEDRLFELVHIWFYVYNTQNPKKTEHVSLDEYRYYSEPPEWDETQ